MAQVAGTEAEQEQEEKIVQSVKAEPLGPCKHRVEIAVSSEVVRREFDNTVRTFAKTAVVPGFRPGRVPRDVVEKRFGKSVREELRGELVEKSLHEAVEGKGWSLLRHPRVEEKDIAFSLETGLSFSAELLVWPQFEVADITGLPLIRRKIETTDADVDREIEHLRRRRAQWIPFEGKAESKDLVIARVTLAVEDQPPVVREAFTILLQEGMVGEIPVADLASRLSGKGSGDVVEIPVEIPVTFTAEPLRGKRGTLAVAVEEVKRARLPEVDEAFARSLEVESVPVLRESVRKALRKEREWAADQDLERQIEDALIARTPFDLPEEAVLAESYRILRQFQRRLLSRGFSPEAVEEKLKEVQKQSRGEAERRLRSRFILERIAEKERIYVSEQEVDRYLAALAGASGERPEKLRSEMERDGSFDDVRSQLRHAKVMEHLKSKATLTEA